MYPSPSKWPNRWWSIGAFFFGAVALAQLVLLAFAVRDQVGRGMLSVVGSLLASVLFFVLCVDRTTWSPSWITRFLDQQLRRKSGDRAG
jgi:hypothetical protein